MKATENSPDTNPPVSKNISLDLASLKEAKLKVIENEIASIIKNSPGETDPEHSISTKKWVLKLKPDADEALQIAALAHDIERGMKKGFDAASRTVEGYKDRKQEHVEKSAKIIVGLLEKEGFGDQFIKKVEKLVLLHETGGDEESDILRDADSISFFEDNLAYYFEEFGEEKTRYKIKYMFDRMSPEIKSIIKGLKYGNDYLSKILKEVLEP